MIQIWQIAPTNEFMLMANSVHELVITVIPKSSGQRIMYINVVGILLFTEIYSYNFISLDKIRINRLKSSDTYSITI